MTSLQVVASMLLDIVACQVDGCLSVLPLKCALKPKSAILNPPGG